MIEEHARVIGREGKLLAFPRTDIAELIEHVNACCVEIHGMTVAVVRMVMQCELDCVTLPNPDQWAWYGAIIGPHALGVTSVVYGNFDFLDRHLDVHRLSVQGVCGESCHREQCSG